MRANQTSSAAEAAATSVSKSLSSASSVMSVPKAAVIEVAVLDFAAYTQL
jgi:hypothetical protein